MMVVPLGFGAVLATLFPNFGRFFGSFTGALFTGSLPILAVFYTCLGSTIEVRSLPRVVRSGGVLLGTKVVLGIVAASILGRLLGTGPVHHGWLAGLSALAVVAAINDTNGGIYMALMAQYGRAEDAAAYSIMAVESGPFLTMLTLGVAGLATFPWQTMLGSVLPLLIGMLLGNLDPELRKFLGGAAPVLIPFFGFAVGSTLDLRQIGRAGLLGLALSVVVLLVSSVFLILANRLSGGDGTAGVAAATTAGNAAAVPSLVAAANPAYAEAAGPATVLVAASVIVTALLAPPLTAWWYRRVTRGRERRAGFASAAAAQEQQPDE
jgi:2-keto-3-deoxygluconate permease